VFVRDLDALGAKSVDQLLDERARRLASFGVFRAA
jgi:hypothetical protein